ncbi:MAG: hypothetical protein CME59_02165 [Halioglobus sp.]|nr:hypothetical protein [Halioglobus sp.]|tara:strand:- start:3454 stop:4590 length:1137 start_codon:yes stop_codon:yes gene_type:complete
MKKWFDIKARKHDQGSQANVAQVTIDGIIGGGSWWDDGGVASDAFMNAMNALGDLQEIHIDLNSPGGSVSDGLTIANFLRAHPARVVVNVLGQASSIASVIAASADEVNMGLGSFGLLHYPWTAAVGNADEFRDLAKDLDTIGDGILDTYLARIGEDRREELEGLIRGDIGQGTILSAQQWLDLGLADSMMETKAAATACLVELGGALAKMGEEAQARLHPSSAEQLTAVGVLAAALELEEDAVEGDLEAVQEQLQARMFTQPQELEAQELASMTLEELQAACPRLIEDIQAGVDAPGKVKAERDRVLALMNACKTTGDYGALEKLVTEDWDADKGADFVLTAAAAAPGIHSQHSPEGGQNTGIDTKAIYGRRNNRAQ